MTRRMMAMLSLGVLVPASLLGGPASSKAATTKATTTAAGTPLVRFIAFDVHLDVGERSLAAYQVEVTAAADRFAIVGVEGGEHDAFARPPYYDPAALRHHRIVIAALDTGKDLPNGKTRVARIHARVVGEQDPDVQIKLVVATDRDGKDITAKAFVVRGDKP